MKKESVNNPVSNSSRISIRKYSSLAIAGFFVFVFILILMHFIHPEFSPNKRFMSEYVLGEFGWLLNIAIIGNLIGSIALIKAIYHSYLPPLRSWTAIICFGIATVSILTNFFPADIHGKAVTISGYIHNFGAFIGSVAGLIFMFIISIRLKVSGLLQGWYRILFLLAIVAPIFFLAMLIIFEGIPGFVVGIVQPIYVGSMLLWLIITSNGIRSGAIAPGAK